MAARFWVGGTGTWDASDTTHWAATSGGAGGQSVPGSSDDVTFDSSSGGGTVTVNTTVTVIAITMNTFGGTLDFATNNNNVTISGTFSSTGSGTRTLNMGNGTWTMSGNAPLWTLAGATNFTFNANSSTLAFTGTAGTTARRVFLGTSRTYNILTLASALTAEVTMTLTTATTIGTLTISPGNKLNIDGNGNVTLNITTLSNISGNSSAQTIFRAGTQLSGRPTISSANNFTGDWCGFDGIRFTGGGTFTANNSANYGDNTGITINAPSAGSGGGQRVFGG